MLELLSSVSARMQCSWSHFRYQTSSSCLTMSDVYLGSSGFAAPAGRSCMAGSMHGTVSMHKCHADAGTETLQRSIERGRTLTSTIYRWKLVRAPSADGLEWHNDPFAERCRSTPRVSRSAIAASGWLPNTRGRA